MAIFGSNKKNINGIKEQINKLIENLEILSNRYDSYIHTSNKRENCAQFDEGFAMICTHITEFKNILYYDFLDEAQAMLTAIADKKSAADIKKLLSEKIAHIKRGWAKFDSDNHNKLIPITEEYRLSDTELESILFKVDIVGQGLSDLEKQLENI